MAVKPTYPGVYVQEVPSGVNTIVGVSTSITAFVGIALKNPKGFNEPVMIRSFAEFERLFGGLWEYSTMSYAVYYYFLNGGRDAIIVCIDSGAEFASGTLSSQDENIEGGVSFTAKEASNRVLKVEYYDDNTLGHVIAIKEVITIEEETTEEVLEEYSSISFDPDAWNNLYEIINEQSEYVTCSKDDDYIGEVQVTTLDGGQVPIVTPEMLIGSSGSKTGVYALDKVDIFNILCVPPPAFDDDMFDQYGAIAKYCKDRRAILLVDPKPTWDDGVTVDANDIEESIKYIANKNSAIYFPMIKGPDPLNPGEMKEFWPSGAMAGLIARTDGNRGIWKAPAGIKATIKGTQGLSYKLTDGENGELNPKGINCLRNFPVYGTVSWGARTMVGADEKASEWKYLSVRRVALYIEESLFRGLKWAVFEPNDEPLWARMKLSASVFMNDLFKKGAFQGATPKEAYFVKCDGDTTTQSDINQGIVNIIIGFAPLKPAEFVIIKLKQIAGNPME